MDTIQKILQFSWITPLVKEFSETLAAGTGRREMFETESHRRRAPDTEYKHTDLRPVQGYLVLMLHQEEKLRMHVVTTTAITQIVMQRVTAKMPIA